MSLESEVTVTEQMRGFVDAVKKYALEHYNEKGWDFVVETMEDDQIKDDIEQGGLSGKKATTVEQAIAAVGEICELLDDRRRDIQSTAW
jgi:hypothetical protein